VTKKRGAARHDHHTACNETAANATRKAVKNFVRTVFKLK
jgi:hypothetical protein